MEESGFKSKQIMYPFRTILSTSQYRLLSVIEYFPVSAENSAKDYEEPIAVAMNAMGSLFFHS